jgi:hypothetical protein
VRRPLTLGNLTVPVLENVHPVLMVHDVPAASRFYGKRVVLLSITHIFFPSIIGCRIFLQRRRYREI